MSELFFLHRATLPSIKSKKSPNGNNAIASQRWVRSSGLPRQYRSDENILIAPQKPGVVLHVNCLFSPPSRKFGGGRFGLTIKFRDQIGQVERSVGRVLLGQYIFRAGRANPPDLIRSYLIMEKCRSSLVSAATFVWVSGAIAIVLANIPRGDIVFSLPSK